jgi:sigma-B regulation protein RsbU (phosphoserine phosphatase)
MNLSDNRLCLAIGEVSEIGVPAALFMAVTRTLIRATAEYETDPQLILQRVNQRLAVNNPHRTSVTLSLMVLDLDTGELKWANANHAPAAVVDTSGQVRFLEGHSGPVCGLHTSTPYLGFQSRLASGDTLVCYTNGIIETTAPNGDRYGHSRLVQLISQPTTDAHTLASQLQDHIQSFAAGVEQAHDLTLLVVRRL